LPREEGILRLARIASALVVLAALAASGCGDNRGYANEARPPVPVTLTASIDDQGVRVSPAKVGAGPIELIIANLTDRTRRVTLESDTLANDAPGIKQQTAPINPQGTARLQVEVQPGRYLVHTGNKDDAFALRVGKERASSQDQLLLP
jgi:hypothetical protein